MFRQYFQGHDLLAFPLAALVIFLGAFIAIVIAALRSSPDQTRVLAGMPLDDDTASAASKTVLKTASSENRHVG